MAACVEEHPRVQEEPEQSEHPSPEKEREEHANVGAREEDEQRQEELRSPADGTQQPSVPEGPDRLERAVPEGEPQRKELESQELLRESPDAAPEQEEEEERMQQEAETKQKEEPLATFDADERAAGMECATQVFISSAAQGEAASQMATQVCVPLQAHLGMEAPTQAFPAMDDAPLHECSTQGLADMATQAFAVTETATQAPMDVENQASAPTASIEFSTQALPEAALRVFSPTKASEAPAAMDTEETVSQAKPKAGTEVKRPKSAYHLFSEEVRSQVIEEIGSKRASMVTAATAARWKSLDAAAKEGYTARAKDLKQQFDEDIAQGASPAVSTTQARRLSKLGKGKVAAAKVKSRRLRTVELLKRRAGPKKPKGSYSIWLGENRKKVRAKLVEDGAVNPSFEDIARAAGKAWLALTKEQKAPYVERAKVLSVKFKDINKACKEYKKANSKDHKAKAKAEAKKKAKQQAAQKKKDASKKTQQQGSLGVAPKTSSTPKRSTSEGTTKSTPSKAKKVVAEKTVYLDMGLLAEAEKAGLAGTFRRLAERDDMKPYSQRVLLDALVANEGLLHRAKDCVLTGKA